MLMSISGIEINYYDKGEGDAVVFLHGWGSSFTVFQSFLDSIAPYYRACALDFPGFGESGEPKEAWGVDEYADFTLSFLEKLGIKSAVLIGHSFGGRVIIKLISKNNTALNIKKVILVDSAGIKPKKTIAKKVRLLTYKAVKNIISTKLIMQIDPNLIESWRKKHGSPDYLSATPIMRECFVKVINEDLEPYLRLFNCPTLLIWGENDMETPLSDAKLMERSIKDSGLVVVKNAGHYPFIDQAYMFGKVLDSFLNIRR